MKLDWMDSQIRSFEGKLFIFYLPLISVMYVHSEESGSKNNTQHGTEDQDGVDGNVHLCVLD